MRQARGAGSFLLGGAHAQGVLAVLGSAAGAMLCAPATAAVGRVDVVQEVVVGAEARLRGGSVGRVAVRVPGARRLRGAEGHRTTEALNIIAIQGGLRPDRAGGRG